MNSWEAKQWLLGHFKVIGAHGHLHLPSVPDAVASETDIGRHQLLSNLRRLELTSNKADMQFDVTENHAAMLLKPTTKHTHF